MVAVDRAAPNRFLRTAFEADDWVAVFLKNYRMREIAQRVVSVSAATNSRFQAWLRHRNANGWNVYVSVNAVVPGRSRARRAIAAVRHVFLEEDRDGPKLLTRLASRSDLPSVSYVLHSSPGRIHVFWRVQGFTPEGVEALQKRLSRELGTDSAATSCSQTTRLPGFVNHKRELPYLVTVDYHEPDVVFAPSDLPTVSASARMGTASRARLASRGHTDLLDRARRYVASVAPAVAGEHGDVRTFRICCRLVRGFALTDPEALSVLMEWNRRCEPPWSERELLEKLRNARRYGSEPIGGLVNDEPCHSTHT